MITSTTGRLGYVTLTAGAFILVALIVDALYHGFSETAYVVALAGLLASAVGFALLMRDPHAREVGWKIILATPFTSNRGKWSQLPIYFSLFTLTNTLIARHGPDTQSPDYWPLVSAGMAALAIGLGLLLTQGAGPGPPTVTKE